MEELNNSIFGKPLKEITVEDVQAFCQRQIKEGINLDYKRDLSTSKQIVKTIAAFGNTRGGWIIVGVDDSNDLPMLPAEGMPYEEHLPLTLTNMVLSQMNPPLIPFIHVCKPNNDNKTFIVMYVPESHEAPHWVFNNSKLYIRVSERTDSGDWERYATSTEWEWLRNKRQKSENLRAETKKKLESNFLDFDNKKDLEELYNNPPTSLTINSLLPKVTDTVSKIINNMLTFVISPMFPQLPLMETKHTYDILDKISVNDYYGTSDKFPAELIRKRIYQTGTLIYDPWGDEKRKFFTALDIVGMLMYKETAVFHDKSAKEILFPNYVDFAMITSRIDEFLCVAERLYTSIGYAGLLNFSLHLHGSRWMKMKFPSTGNFSFDYRSPKKDFYYEKTFLSSSLSNDAITYDVIKDVIEELMFAFGWKDFNWFLLDKILKQNPRYQSVIK